jgi:NAD(P)-dependent dehydrogenase (short-subunit alcohol dehydrogenase family)
MREFVGSHDNDQEEASPMDVGLKGRNAIVCAASMGLGKACAKALANEGVNVVIVARRPEPLKEAAAEIGAATGLTPVTVAADVTTEEGRAAILKPVPPPTSSLTMPAARRRAISATGRARTGSRPSTPTCWRRSN